MKTTGIIWRRCTTSESTGCLTLCLLTALATLSLAVRPATGLGPVGPSDRPEAYFNGSSYIRLSRPISLKQLVGLSYRTCVGGELFSQRYEGFTLHVTALWDSVVVSWTKGAGNAREASLPRATLDNKWHWLALRYRPSPPSLLLELDKDSQIISNVTWNPELVSAGGGGAAGGAGEAGGQVGHAFAGCVREGPQLEFHRDSALPTNVLFEPCPLDNEPCKERNDPSHEPPRDFCYNEPCMRHGTCISRHDKYECVCYARYGGNNCEVELGPPCARSPPPCAPGGVCRETDAGHYACLCLPGYQGVNCEVETAATSACASQPCSNNATCSDVPARVPSTAAAPAFICECPPGWTGATCDVEIADCDECENGGVCLEGENGFACDCSNTGYEGDRCQHNVDECARGVHACGHGVCYDTYGGYVCACRPGYTGDHCQIASACASGPCGAGGACVEEGGTFRCVCARGLLPPTCEPRDRCRCPPHSHCAHHGTTTNTNKQICVCDTGYYGAPGPAPNCSRVEDACAASVCLNGGTCAQHRDHFNCTCAPHYRGVYCEAAAPAAASGKALAEKCAAQPCVHAASCLDTSAGFRCECEAGWGGARCDVPATDPCSARGCQHGAACRVEDGAALCECRAGYSGALCELPDCRAAPCANEQECVEENGAWRCAERAAVSPCGAGACHNGSCVPDDARPDGFACVCPAGITGRLCETDVDECALMPKICNNGVCVNNVGSYQCYCRPGFTGAGCDQDIDECLSAPCRNGATCTNLENDFECTCPDGFEGKDCSVNIDECAASPCVAGATCVDGVGAFTCVCPAGLTGDTCALDIDDCAAQPCLHQGVCNDLVGGFSCSCAGTGFAGPTCAEPVDECASQPCRRGAPCLDQLADYRCLCPKGYSGKNCEVDDDECVSSPCLHGGVCLQRSNRTLHRLAADAARAGAPLQVGPQPHMTLPHYFSLPFDYANASGVECVCPLGTAGAHCEVDVDECAAAPCLHGRCEDLVGGYACHCEPGYEGATCHSEIDECERYAPCVRGRCYDRRAGWWCACEPGWGGRNCSVLLTGCAGEPCAHRGECRAYLRHETDHAFNCSCTPGYHGPTCTQITTMSLEKTSYVEVNTTRDEGYDISFRFKTTLGNGLLAMGRGLTYFFLELSNGRLNLHSSLLNKWEGVFIGSNLNDSKWQKVFVTINSSHVVLAANEEQTIYPISQNEAANSSVTSFPSTRLGAPGSSYSPLMHGPHSFVGCVQDVLVNGQWVLPPQENVTAVEGSMHGVAAECPRREQCEPNPCRSGGRCEDHWTAFRCYCSRPHLGHACQHSYTAATFLHESVSRGVAVRVDAREAVRRALRAALDVSLFVRTRKPRGDIFYLGNGGRRARDETCVAASLRAGELLLHLRFNSTPEEYAVGGTRLDNGYMHLIEVVRNSTLVQVKLNGTEYFRKSISAARQLDAQVLYLGGPPPPPEPEPAPSGAPPAPAPLAANTSAEDTYNEDDYFKGVIQDVQISNGVNVTIVELFPLEVEDAVLPPPFGTVRTPAEVLPGQLSDDACRAQPCAHHAPCRTTFNDYVCECPRGYKGKQCTEVEFCQLEGCPTNSHCQNLDTGYECVSNATFDGVNTTLAYRLREPPSAAAPAPAQADLPDSLSITFRSKYGGTLFHAELIENGTRSWFSVGVYMDDVSVQWGAAPAPAPDAAPPTPAAPAPAPANTALPTLRRMRKTPPDFQWTTIVFNFKDNMMTGSFVDAESEPAGGVSAPLRTLAWQRLVTQGTLLLGGVAPHPAPSPPSPTPPASAAPPHPQTDSSTGTTWEYPESEEWTDDNSIGEYFKGCIGAARVGGRLLPFFSEEELFVGAAAELLAAQPHYALLWGVPYGRSEGVGCVLCAEAQCGAGGRCADVRALYHCLCPPGRKGDRCEIEIDECIGHQCQNNATCRDELAKYSCICEPGFEGDFCEREADACAGSPCLHGGTCVRGAVRGTWRCACPAGRGGDTCAARLPASCAERPCAPGRATCRDLPPVPPTGNNYTCECAEGFVGALCADAYCEAEPCLHGGTCAADAKVPTCLCPEGYSGRRCERAHDACAAQPCLHGGTCRAADPPRYSCLCDDTGYTGARCERDVDECASGAVSCGPGQCLNLQGSYTCMCAPGFCGLECALADPCYAGAASVTDGASVTEGASDNSSLAVAGPCANGGTCRQRCTHVQDYTCLCAPGWAPPNCTTPVTESLLGGGGAGGLGPGRLALAVGAALLLLALLAGAGAALAAQARRKRATRGTYSPSGQEYCNPRAEMMQHALKPPPEERLI